MNDFAALLQKLAPHVEFIIVGGVAATIHGASRLTQDIDIVYSRSDENIGSLAEALAPLHPYPRGVPPGLPFRWDKKTISQGLNFTLTTNLGEIDLLGEITGGGGYEDLLPHSFMIHAFNVELRCLELDWLIYVKRAAGRPKDFEAIAELEAIRDHKNQG
jgi:hypothetical protein